MSGKLDQAAVAKASRLYHTQKLTVREVAKIMDVDERTVRRWLAGTLRRRGQRGRVDVSDAKVVALRTEGLSERQIAAQTGLSRGAIRKRIERMTRERYEASP